MLAPLLSLEIYDTAHSVIQSQDKTLQTQQTVPLILPLVKRILWAALGGVLLAG